MARKDVDVHIRAHDRMTRSFQRASGASRGLGVSLGKLAGIAAGFVGFRMIARGTIAAISESVAFQKQLAEVSTMLDDNVGPTMARFKTEIMTMAVEFGQSKEVLSKGLYDILSAGIDASGAIDVLRVAARGAVGGVTDAAVAVDALTTVINAYGLSADDATKVSDLMFSTVKEGKITYEELAENIGKIAPVAKAANVPLEDMFAMLATAVKVEKPERAFTAIRAALMTAAKEGRNFLDVVREMRGATLQQILAGKKQEDQIIATAKAAKESGQDAVVFAKRAAVGVSILTGNWQELEKQVVIAGKSTGKADIAFQKMADTNALKIASLGQAWANVKTEIGDAVAESDAFQDGIKIIMRTIRQLRGKEKEVLLPPRPVAPPTGAAPTVFMLKAGVGRVPEALWEAMGEETLPGLAARARGRAAGLQAGGISLGPLRRQHLNILRKIEKNTQQTTRNTEVTVEGRSFR